MLNTHKERYSTRGCSDGCQLRPQGGRRRGPIQSTTVRTPSHPSWIPPTQTSFTDILIRINDISFHRRSWTRVYGRNSEKCPGRILETCGRQGKVRSWRRNSCYAASVARSFDISPVLLWVGLCPTLYNGDEQSDRKLSRSRVLLAAGLERLSRLQM